MRAVVQLGSRIQEKKKPKSKQSNFLKEQTSKFRVWDLGIIIQADIGDAGIVEEKMETTIMGYIGVI